MRDETTPKTPFASAQVIYSSAVFYINFLLILDKSAPMGPKEYEAGYIDPLLMGIEEIYQTNEKSIRYAGVGNLPPR